jgi:hypothetical protein
MPRRDNDESDARKIKTETVTFRLPSSLIDELRMDAELESVSLNNYVAKIFSNHIQWERYERKVGLLPMTEAFLREVLNQLTDEQIVNLAQRLEKQKFTNILAFMKNSHSVDDFVEVIRAWLTVSWMQQNIEVRDGKYHFKIQHSLGAKWSLYVQTLLSELSYDILGRKADISIVGDTLSFVFTK